jgi:predicted HTH domain antitoxin
MRESVLQEVHDMGKKTLSIRMDDDDYRFLSVLAQEEKEDVSKKDKRSEASMEKAAKIAGVSIAKMMDILKEHGVEANLEYEDYLKGLKSLEKMW